MKILVLTEKPSVARDFARALGPMQKKNGYLEGESHVVTWAIGHLVGLCEPQDYDPALKRWRYASLPIIPSAYRYKPIPATQKQLTIIQGLLSRGNFEKLVIATDAGREGEVIARTILETTHTPVSIPRYRFWTSQALTSQVIQKGMHTLQPAGAYDRLWAAGRCRQIADWLVGMNASRAATISMQDLFSVGRVQTAVLALLTDRARAREAFQPQPYWQVRAVFENAKGTWQGVWVDGSQSRIMDQAKALKIAADVEGKGGRVIEAKREEKRTPPPPLYSLTELQREANKKYGLSAKATLAIAQDLYEKKKCLSYPRTDATVLGSDNVSMVKAIITELAHRYAGIFQGVDHSLISPANRRVFNDRRLTDHHALIPLAALPANAREQEQRIYNLVLTRFAAAFYPDCRYEKTEIRTRVQNGEIFRSQGRVIRFHGWQALLEKHPKASKSARVDEPVLPPLTKGDAAQVRKSQITTKNTQPPPKYTEALLLKDMINPAKYVKAQELKKIYRHDAGLGTQATRAQIIETLLARRYVIREKRHLLPTSKGLLLIDNLRKFEVAGTLASPEKTAQWEQELKAIAQGQGSADAFLRNIEGFVKTTIAELKAGRHAISAKSAPSLGRCPACKGEVVDGFKWYACQNWKRDATGCPFIIWKKIAGKRISPQAAARLIQGKTVGPYKGFISKRKKRFTASLKLVCRDAKWAVAFDFDTKTASPNHATPAWRDNQGRPAKRSQAPDDLGLCPVCGGAIIEGRKGYGCTNWRERDGGCRFVIWREIQGKRLSHHDIKTLTTGIPSPRYLFRESDGRRFRAGLTLEKRADDGYEVVFIDREPL